MAKISLSTNEKNYIIHSAQENLREDGRSCMDFRTIEVETDVLPLSSGSSHVKLLGTELLVSVKADLDAPQPSHLNKGRIEIFVDCSPNANPEFEGRGGEDIASEISYVLTQAYGNPRCLDLESLCLLPEQKVWVLYIDITILECNGNLIDAAAIGVKAALYDTKIPVVNIQENGEGGFEIEVSEDPYDVKCLDIKNFPCLITLLRIGSHFIVDATQKEEESSKAKLIMAVSSDGSIMLTKKIGFGSLHPETILDVLESGQEMGKHLNDCLLEKLRFESSMKKEKKCFLV